MSSDVKLLIAVASLLLAAISLYFALREGD